MKDKSQARSRKKFLPVRHFYRKDTALRAKAFISRRDKRLRFNIVRDKDVYALVARSRKGLKRAHKILGKKWIGG